MASSFKNQLAVLLLLSCAITSIQLRAQTCDPNNYAANKTIVTSEISETPGSNLVDGNISTDWYSGSDSKWVYVDLGESKNLCKVTLKWNYWTGIPQTIIQGSNTANNDWVDLYTIPSSDHGNHSADGNYDYIDVSLSTITTPYRYVRLYYASGVSWGPHLKEFEVYIQQPIATPNVSITAPSNGSTFIQGSNVTLSANASEDGGTISKVEFYANNVLLGQVTTPPFNFTWTNVQAGDFIILAHAHDGSGQMTVSSSDTIHVPQPIRWSLTGNTANASSAFLGTTDNQPLIFKTNGAERLRILSDGRVGIKTSLFPTGDSTVVLAVGGSIYARKLKVTQSTWADYVFNKNYKLLSLQEVEAYVKQHHHLPGIEPAGKIIGDGLDVGNNVEILLKKVEELTLYMIDLNKEVQTLKEQNSSLKKQLNKRRK